MGKPGTIYLVGAGPGDADLLTLRAARLIESADLIVHDGLVDASILSLARSDARLVSVAKRRAHHTLPQDDINALLVREARAGRDVVRLRAAILSFSDAGARKWKRRVLLVSRSRWYPASARRMARRRRRALP